MITRIVATSAEIEALMRTAADLGDGETVEDCGRALSGSRSHRLWCERLIRGNRSADHDRSCACDDCRWLDDWHADRIEI